MVYRPGGGGESRRTISSVEADTRADERDKVLDLIITFRKEQSKELKIHDMWVAEAEYLKELRQAGEP